MELNNLIRVRMDLFERFSKVFLENLSRGLPGDLPKRDSGNTILVLREHSMVPPNLPFPPKSFKGFFYRLSIYFLFIISSSRKILRRIFPTADFGRAVRNSTIRGILYAASLLLQKLMISLSVTIAPGFRTT